MSTYFILDLKNNNQCISEIINKELLKIHFSEVATKSIEEFLLSISNNPTNLHFLLIFIDDQFYVNIKNINNNLYNNITKAINMENIFIFPIIIKDGFISASQLPNEMKQIAKVNALTILNESDNKNINALLNNIKKYINSKHTSITNDNYKHKRNFYPWLFFLFSPCLFFEFDNKSTIVSLQIIYPALSLILTLYYKKDAMMLIFIGGIPLLFGIESDNFKFGGNANYYIITAFLVFVIYSKNNYNKSIEIIERVFNGRTIIAIAIILIIFQFKFIGRYNILHNYSLVFSLNMNYLVFLLAFLYGVSGVKNVAFIGSVALGLISTSLLINIAGVYFYLNYHNILITYLSHMIDTFHDAQTSNSFLVLPSINGGYMLFIELLLIYYIGRIVRILTYDEIPENRTIFVSLSMLFYFFWIICPYLSDYQNQTYISNDASLKVYFYYPLFITFSGFIFGVFSAFYLASWIIILTLSYFLISYLFYSNMSFDPTTPIIFTIYFALGKIITKSLYTKSGLNQKFVLRQDY